MTAQMSRIVGAFVTFLCSSETSECGQGLVEYSLVATFVSITAVALLTMVGQALPNLFAGALHAL
jgi:Flp pilus assembly pilin Flp